MNQFFYFYLINILHNLYAHARYLINNIFDRVCRRVLAIFYCTIITGIGINIMAYSLSIIYGSGSQLVCPDTL